MFLIRSNASRVIDADGDAPAQQDGTIEVPAARASFRKPLTGSPPPSCSATIASPRAKGGKKFPRSNAAQSAAVVFAKLLVSC